MADTGRIAVFRHFWPVCGELMFLFRIIFILGNSPAPRCHWSSCFQSCLWSSLVSLAQRNALRCIKHFKDLQGSSRIFKDLQGSLRHSCINCRTCLHSSSSPFRPLPQVSFLGRLSTTSLSVRSSFETAKSWGIYSIASDARYSAFVINVAFTCTHTQI